MLGVVLINTGSTAAPQPQAVRQYLRRFLSDRRVVELPRLPWLALLNAIILPLRAPRSAHKYRSVWLDRGSPHAVYSAELRDALEQELEQHLGTAVQIEQAFLYAAPSVPAALERLRAAGMDELVVLPLYPQASGTTTGGAWDQSTQALRTWRAFPRFRFIADYHDAPRYIEALADSVREHWARHGRTAHLLLSFHGIPQRCVEQGDAYAKQCHRTAAALAAALALSRYDWSLSFQSRFGPAQWLAPATTQVLAELPHRGVRSLSVLCPGFSVDCLETLEEIGLEGRRAFLAAGGETFQYVPALNGRADHARALAELILAGRAA